MHKGRNRIAVTVLAGALAAGAAAHAADPAASRSLQPEDLKALTWRSIGPANMAGRVASIAIAPGNAKTIFVGYATGGVWKSTNRGTTFAPTFDRYETSSIGALAVCDAPTSWSGWKDDAETEKADRAEKGKAKIVWVGTGEGNGRNSSSWGHGVYRSTDGGGSYEHKGLEETHDIPALAVDPRDPDVCYVAALGRLWGANDERGVYKTTDGGKTWKAVLQIDDRTGACDVVIDPAKPDTVYAAMYDRRRTPWSYRSGGPEGGIYRSRDAGRTWKKLANGLPDTTGRIGLSIHAADPKIIFAVVESTDGGWVGDAFSNRQREGGVFRTADAGDTWERTTDFNPRSFYFSKIRVDPVDPARVYLLEWGVSVSDDGGRTFRAGLAKVAHVDFHAMVIDPDDTDHLLAGSDGGLYVSWDRGKTWDFHDHMAVGQFYNVTVDDSDPYRVGGGLQDNGTWIGPSETITEDKGEWMGRAGAITNKDWSFIWGGDGFHVAFDPEDPNVVYAEWQGGNINRVHRDTGQWRNIKPVAREGEPRFRFNWNAPFFVSPHDPKTLYHGGNCVFRLTGRGDRWERISDDLSTRDLEKMITEGSEAETHGTVVSLAESPVEAGLLWAGTDDGLIHVTTDDGAKWKDVTPKAAGGLYVSKIEPSPHDRRVAYAAIDGHRSDVFEPVLLETRDLGRTWTSIAGNLPDGAPVKVVRADLRNAKVLYAGTERAAWVTIDGGGHWVKLNGKSLPTVAVDDLAIQAREMDLVAGTHGRSIYILDGIASLSALTPGIVASEFHVFRSMPGRPRYLVDYGAIWSDRMFAAKNPPMGASIDYWIRDYTGDDVEIVVSAGTDGVGYEVRKLKGTSHPGINRVTWDLQAEKDMRLGNPHELTEFVPAGTYTVTVKYGERSEKTTVEVLAAPGD